MTYVAFKILKKIFLDIYHSNDILIREYKPAFKNVSL